MTKRQTAIVTLFKLHKIEKMRTALEIQCRAEAVQVKIANCEGLLYKNSYSKPASWAGDISRLTDTTVKLENEYASAVLILRDSNENLWALAWGQGYRRLNHDVIDTRFGMRFLARALSSKKLRGASHTVLDHRGKSGRTVIPGGASVNELGILGYGELVNAANGSISLEGLSACERNSEVKPASGKALTKTREISVRGGDSLRIPLSMEPKKLLSDLSVIAETLKRDPLQEYQLLDQLIPVLKSSTIHKRLEDHLRIALKEKDSSKLAVFNLFESAQFDGYISSYKITSLGTRAPKKCPEFVSLEDIFEFINSRNEDDILDRIRMIKLRPYRDNAATDPFSGAIPLRKWLLAELYLEEARYCLLDGNWYHLDTDYSKNIEKRFQEILEQSEIKDLPIWPSDVAEGEYNLRLSRHYEAVLMDKDLSKTSMHNRLELCDVYRTDGVLMHVKRARSSSELSHLYAQALVSADSILSDERTRAVWYEKVREASPTPPGDISMKELWIVHGTDKDLKSGELFTFSKVNLIKQVSLLESRGVKVRIMRAPSN